MMSLISCEPQLMLLMCFLLERPPRLLSFWVLDPCSNKYANYAADYVQQASSSSREVEVAAQFGDSD
uniref:Putative secreted protein n=1 Tax=Anopheles darlingi TaxID=43151 RepID=A0A2M4D1Q7_ANODA